MEGAHKNVLENKSPGSSDEVIDNAVNAISNLTLSEKNVTEKSTGSTKRPLNFYKMQCPYTWKECTTKFDEIDWVERLLIKLSRPNCNDWRLYSFKLLLGCIYGHKNEEGKASEAFGSCEKHVNEKSDEIFFKDIVEGMKHVIHASKCHMNFQIGNQEFANEVASSMKPFKDLSKESQAAVWATKAYILSEFGYDGKMKALECSKLAVELDPDDDGRRNGAWYYLAGKTRAQLRRINAINDMPSKEELKLLERSVKKDPFSVHLVVLADSYREAAKIHFKTSYKNTGMSDKLCQASLNMYKKAIEDKNLNVGVLRRCGSGLMKLPKKYRDWKLAEETLRMALKLAPENSAVLFALGNLEAWCKNNSTAALAYYEKSYNCGNENAAINMIKYRYELDKAYNPIGDCNKYISRLRNVLQSKMSLERMMALMLIKGEFYLNVKHDLLGAAREWEEGIETSPDSNMLLEYKCIFIDNRRNWNIYEVLTKEINMALRLKKVSLEDQVYLSRLLKICQEKKL